MSCYNASETIDYAIKSVMGQTFRDFEFLIMDDCSTDNTLKIIKNNQKLDKRIKIFQNSKNLGLTKSLNILISESKGEYIARQDADDISKAYRLEHQLNFMKNNKKYDACTSRAVIKNSNRKIPKYSIYLPNKLVVKYKNPFIHGTLLCKKEIISSVGNYDENFYFSQDYKLFSDLLGMNYRIKILSKVLYELNMKNNISSNLKEEQKYYSDCVKNNTKPNLY